MVYVWSSKLVIVQFHPTCPIRYCDLLNQNKLRLEYTLIAIAVSMLRYTSSGIYVVANHTDILLTCDPLNINRSAWWHKSRSKRKDVQQPCKRLKFVNISTVVPLLFLVHMRICSRNALAVTLLGYEAAGLTTLSYSTSQGLSPWPLPLLHYKRCLVTGFSLSHPLWSLHTPVCARLHKN